MDYCPHCMRAVSGAAGKCPHCGGDLGWTGQIGYDLPVGTVLAGGNGLRTYQIGAARGRGGFGITYVALETNSRRRVAVKEYFPIQCAVRAGAEVQPKTSQDMGIFQGGMKSFLDEGRMLLAQEDLPSVVRVIDYFQANGTAYLVMEYLDGSPLHVWMKKRGGRIPAKDLLEKLAPVIRDLGRLHQRGVLHRDISPDNLMWMPDGSIKLLDFGSARSIENGKSMTVLMKPGFSPIEQYRSRGQGPFSDVYAMAATIYYCLTGVIPPAAIDRLDGDPLQSPNELGAGLTAQQEAALMRALAVQPRERFQTMEAFAAELLKKEPAPPPKPKSNIVRCPNGHFYDAAKYGACPNCARKRRKRRLPLIIGAIAAAVVLVLVILLFSAFSDREPEPVTGELDGYEYEIVDGSYAVITGYDSPFRMDEIPGEIPLTQPWDSSSGAEYLPVKEIGSCAFWGVETAQMVTLPASLEYIGSLAFNNCSGLMAVMVNGTVNAEEDAFEDTDLQYVLLAGGGSMEGPSLDSGVQVYRAGMSCALGTVDHFSMGRTNNGLYGITTGGKAVLLSVPSEEDDMFVSEEVDGCPVEWVEAGALDLCTAEEITLRFPDECAYDYSLSRRLRCVCSDNSLTDMWDVTCKLADAVNGVRAPAADRIQPSLPVIRAAWTRAKELQTLDSWDRPNGEDGFTALDDERVEHLYASACKGGGNPRGDDWADYIKENYAQAIEDEDVGESAGWYYTHMGVAYFYDKNTQHYNIYGFFIIAPSEN